YVMWLRLPKNVFVVAISQMFTVGSLGLALGLLLFGGASPQQLGLSALACAPVFGGLLLGQRVRFRMSERRFAVLILATYLITGASFLIRLM
ncbi:MAG: sulfite exporter TauE/SafE family protein, partial [Acidobacteriota bacterium]